MLVAVTGAAGHIGGNLARALAERGHAVRAVVHEERRALDGVPVETVEADVRDRAALERAFAGAEVVYHLAAHIGLSAEEFRACHEVNVDGTANVIAACVAAGVRRLCHFSSIHALSPQPPGEPVDETRRLVEAHEVGPYDASKAAAERLVLAAAAAPDGAGGLDAVVVNPSGVIGPCDFRPSAMGQVLLDLAARRVPALVAGGFNWVDARDVADGAIAAAERGRRGERYLLSGEWRTVGEVARAVERHTGARAPRFTTPMWLARAAAPFATLYSRAAGKRPLFTAASLRALREHRDIRNAKAARELGFTARPFDVTVADTLRWFAAHGALPGPLRA